MRIASIELPPDHEIVLFGDNQRGNVAMAEDRYLATIQSILDTPNRYAIHMGDALEGYWISDSRYTPEVHKKTPLLSMNDEIKALDPLARTGKLIAVLTGNHDIYLRRSFGDVTAEMCRQLRVGEWPLYGTFSLKLELNVGKDLQYKAYFTHGKKQISSVSPDPVRRRSYMLYALKRQLEPVFGDCVLMAKGHTHKLLVLEPEAELYLTTVKGKIKQNYIKPSPGKDAYIPPELRWYANTGSYLRTYVEDIDTYSEMAEYPPLELGYVLVKAADRQIVSVERIVL